MNAKIAELESVNICIKVVDEMYLLCCDNHAGINLGNP